MMKSGTIVKFFEAEITKRRIDNPLANEDDFRE